MDLTYSSFFDQKLLDTEYFRRHRDAYERYFQDGVISKYRCYPVIVEKLQSIYEYNATHARYFARRIAQQGDLRNCEAILSEVIVYSHYIPLVKEGVVESLDVCEDDYDLKIERTGHPDVFLEVFCIMPEFKKNERGVCDMRTHTQTALSSIRQKLLRKMQKQKQMQKARENWAVIELNDVSIAGEFTVLASLSDGYKVIINRETKQVVQRGYDWSNSIFDAPETQNLHGIIHFDLGYYEGRRYILNGRIRAGDSDEKPVVP
jgi:hypothetical protein